MILIVILILFIILLIILSYYKSNEKLTNISSYNVVIEEHDFGHKNIIWQDNGGLQFIDSDITIEKEEKIQKHINNNLLKPVDNQSEYLKLYRYGINKLTKPNDNDDITLSVSFFLQPSVLVSNELLNQKLDRYYQHILIQIIVYNYYFPNVYPYPILY